MLSCPVIKHSWRLHLLKKKKIVSDKWVGELYLCQSYPASPGLKIQMLLSYSEETGMIYTPHHMVWMLHEAIWECKGLNSQNILGFICF